MKKTRLSKYLAPLQIDLKVLVYIFLYLTFYIAGIVCFVLFADIVYNIGLVLFGTNPLSPKGLETAFCFIPSLLASFVLSLVSTTWVLFRRRNKYVVHSFLFPVILFSVYCAIDCNVKMSVDTLYSNDAMVNYLIFLVTYVFIAWLVPHLTRHIDEETPVLAKPVVSKRKRK